jgi:hypothetical protein
MYYPIIKELMFLEEQFMSSVSYWTNGGFLEQNLYMLNRLTNPRISLAVDEFHLLPLYVLNKLLFQVKLET